MSTLRKDKGQESGSTTASSLFIRLKTFNPGTCKATAGPRSTSCWGACLYRWTCRTTSGRRATASGRSRTCCCGQATRRRSESSVSTRIRKPSVTFGFKNVFVLMPLIDTQIFQSGEGASVHVATKCLQVEDSASLESAFFLCPQSVKLGLTIKSIIIVACSMLTQEPKKSEREWYKPTWD